MKGKRGINFEYYLGEITIYAEDHKNDEDDAIAIISKGKSNDLFLMIDNKYELVDEDEACKLYRLKKIKR